MNIGRIALAVALVGGIGGSRASAQTTFSQATIPVNGALSLVAMQSPAGSHTPLVAGGPAGVTVLANDGAGNFSTSVTLPGVSAPSLPGIGVGDVNGDGLLDIVTIGNILWGLSGGTYSQQAFSPPDLGYGTGSGAVAVGDVNGDGYADMAFSIFSYGTGAVTVWLGGPGAPGSWSPSATETALAGFAPFSVAVGNLNGDGLDDVVVANGSSNSISVFDGSAAAPYLTNRQDYSTFAGGYPTPDELRIADVNGDGKLDVLAVGRGPSSVSAFLNNGSGAFGSAVVSSVGPLGTWGPTGSSWDSRAVNVGDFNNDGKADIVVPIPWDLASGPFSQVAILYGDNTGHFAAEQDLAVGNSPVSVVVGDFNGDGLTDFAVGNAGETSVTVMLNTTAPLRPTSKDQCRNGGWRSFGVFKNQGSCVSYVATGGRNQP